MHFSSLGRPYDDLYVDSMIRFLMVAEIWPNQNGMTTGRVKYIKLPNSEATSDGHMFLFLGVCFRNAFSFFSEEDLGGGYFMYIIHVDIHTHMHTLDITLHMYYVHKRSLTFRKAVVSHPIFFLFFLLIVR